MKAVTSLTQQHCQPCEGIGKAMTRDEAAGYLTKVPCWQISSDAKTISRSYLMKNFMSGVKLINLIAGIAEAENHHPDIHLSGYRNLRVDLSTHALKGLTENDFIVAAKINELPAELKINKG